MGAVSFQTADRVLGSRESNSPNFIDGPLRLAGKERVGEVGKMPCRCD
jgi:hypothetical protein